MVDTGAIGDNDNSTTSSHGQHVIARLFHLQEHVMHVEHGVQCSSTACGRYGIRFGLHDEFAYDMRDEDQGNLPDELHLVHGLLRSAATADQSLVHLGRLITELVEDSSVVVPYECWMMSQLSPNTALAPTYSDAMLQFSKTLPVSLREAQLISTRALIKSSSLSMLASFLRTCVNALLADRATNVSHAIVELASEKQDVNAIPAVPAVQLVVESVLEQTARLQQCHGDSYPPVHNQLGYGEDRILFIHNTLWEAPPSFLRARDQIAGYFPLLKQSFVEAAGTDTMSKRKPWVAALFPRLGHEQAFDALFTFNTEGADGSGFWVPHMDDIRSLLQRYTDAYRARGDGSMVAQVVLPFHVYAIGGLHSATVVQEAWLHGLDEASPPVLPGMSVYEQLPAHVWAHLTDQQCRCLGMVDNVDTTMTLGTTNMTLYKHLRTQLVELCAVEANNEGLFKHIKQHTSQLTAAISNNLRLFDVSRGVLQDWCADLTTLVEVHALTVKKVNGFIQGNAMLSDKANWARPMKVISWCESNWLVLCQVNDMFQRGEITISKTFVKAYEDEKKSREKKATQLHKAAQKQSTGKPKSKFGAKAASTPARSKRVIRTVETPVVSASDATAATGKIHTVQTGISVKMMADLGAATDSAMVAQLLAAVVAKIKSLLQAVAEISTHQRWLGFLLAVAHGLSTTINLLRSSPMMQHLDKEKTQYLWSRAQWARNISDPALQPIRNFEHLCTQAGQAFKTFMDTLVRPDSQNQTASNMHYTADKLMHTTFLRTDQPTVPRLSDGPYFLPQVPAIMETGSVLYSGSDQGDDFSAAIIVSGRGERQLEQLAVSMMSPQITSWPGETELPHVGTRYNGANPDLYKHDNPQMPVVFVSMTDFAWQTTTEEAGTVTEEGVLNGITGIQKAVAADHVSLVFFEDTNTTAKARTKFTDHELPYHHRARMLALRSYLHRAESLNDVVCVKEWTLENTVTKGRGLTMSNASAIILVHMRRNVAGAPSTFNAADFYSSGTCDQRVQVVRRGFGSLTTFPTPLIPSVTVEYQQTEENAPTSLVTSGSKVWLFLATTCHVTSY